MNQVLYDAKVSKSSTENENSLVQLGRKMWSDTFQVVIWKQSTVVLKR